MCRVWNMSGFWIFQDFQYARVHNFQGYTGLTYFRKYDRVLNMRRDAIMQGFWIFQDSEYANFPHMRRLHKVPNMPEYGSIMPNKLFWLWHCSKYAWSMFQTLQTHHVYSTLKRHGNDRFHVVLTRNTHGAIVRHGSRASFIYQFFYISKTCFAKNIQKEKYSWLLFLMQSFKRKLLCFVITFCSPFYVLETDSRNWFI